MSKLHRRYVRMHHSRLRQLLMWSSILELRVLIPVWDCHFCLSHSHHQVSAWVDSDHLHYLRRCYPHWPVGLPRSPFGFGIGCLLSTPLRFPSLAVYNGCLLSASHWTVLSVFASLALDILSLCSATLADPVGMTMLASVSCQSCCSPFWYMFAVFPNEAMGFPLGCSKWVVGEGEARLCSDLLSSTCHWEAVSEDVFVYIDVGSSVGTLWPGHHPLPPKKTIDLGCQRSSPIQSGCLWRTWMSSGLCSTRSWWASSCLRYASFPITSWISTFVVAWSLTEMRSRDW